MDKMQKIKKVIKYLIVILVLMLLILLAVHLLNKTKKEEIDNIDIEQVGTINQKVDWDIVKDNSLFFTAEASINNYFMALFQNDIEELENMLDKKYIEKNNITESNILKKCKNNISIEGDIEFIAQSMYYSSNDRLFIIYVQGYIREDYLYDGINESDDIIRKKEKIELIIKLDFNNMSYSINPNYSDNIEELKEPVISNEYNSFKNILVGQETIINRYISKYQNDTIYDIESAYETLDKTYREKKFGNINAYKNFVENQMTYSEIYDYTVSYYDDYTQYICTDFDGNYYIITETASMQYTILLDFYTVDIEKLTAEYDKNTVQEKVGLNIQKVVAALNDKDYQYIYNKLYDEFKSNYYKNLQEFQDYMSKTFLTEVGVSFNDFFNEGETYIYNVTLKAATVGSQEINMQIIMKLKEERDFVMSFSIK